MFDQTLRDISELKIQGAVNIAKAALEAIYDQSQKVKTKEELKENITALEEARSTEPALRNALDLFYTKLQEDFSNREEVYEELKNHFVEAKKKIIEYGANLIQDGMGVYTHCHSSTVTGIIIAAHQQGKKIEVYNTETRPKFQGRITAEELAEAGLKVHHMVDSAFHYALKKADIFLFGADAVNSYGNVFNKVGTKTFAEIAHRLDVKVFSCTDSFKYDPETIYGVPEEIEERDKKEVWKTSNESILIFNPAFDEVEAEHIDGIISEYGVLSPAEFTERANNFFKSK